MRKKLAYGIGIGTIPVVMLVFAMLATGDASTVSNEPATTLKNAPANATLTSTQVASDEQEIGEIITPNGRFVRLSVLDASTRADVTKGLTTTEIGYSKEEANNPNIREFILPYGTFIKVTQAQEKSFDQEWQQSH